MQTNREFYIINVDGYLKSNGERIHLVEQKSENPLTQNEADEICDKFLDIIYEHFAEGKHVSLKFKGIVIDCQSFSAIRMTARKATHY